jgi:hypothetical protein
VTLGRAWALALLVLPAILLWLRFRAARPRAAEASSLLVWRKVSPAGEPAGRPRPPWSAWVEAAGAVLVVLALADPAVHAAAPGEVRVLLDTSPSMHATDGEGRTRLEAARDIVLKYDTMIQESGRPEADLPAILAAGSPVVVVTDHRLPGFEDDPPRLRIVGIGGGGFNAGITAAVGEPAGEGRWNLFLTIEAHGGSGPVEGTLEMMRVDGGPERITLLPGRPLEMTRVVQGDTVLGELSFPGDTWSFDDHLICAAEPVLPVVVRGDRDGPAGPWIRALEAAGAGQGGGGTGDGIVSLATDAPSGNRVVTFRLPLDAAGGEVAGEGVVAADHHLVRDVRVDPSVLVGRRGALSPAGEVLLADSEGPLLAYRGDTGVVEFGFLPGGTWVERDPSFVVLAKNFVDRLSGGPPRLEGGHWDPRETAEAVGESFGDLDAALREAALPDPAARTPLAVMLLLAGGVLLAGAWLGAR